MNNVRIIMYHYVRELKQTRYPGIKGLDVKLFKDQIEFMQNNFNLITMEEMISSIYDGNKLPERAALLTFDDGYIDHFQTVFPILMNSNIQGSFFIPTQPITDKKLLKVNKIHFILATGNEEMIIYSIFSLLDELRMKGYLIPPNDILYQKLAIGNRFDNKNIIFIKRLLQYELQDELSEWISTQLLIKYVGVSEKVLANELYLNMDQIRCMKEAGMFIGVHGHAHHWLGKVEREKMVQDINRGIEILGEVIDPNCWVMNYPYGSYNKDTIEYIKSIGCKLALGTEVGVANISSEKERFCLKRLDTNDIPPKSENYLMYI